MLGEYGIVPLQRSVFVESLREANRNIAIPPVLQGRLIEATWVCTVYGI